MVDAVTGEVYLTEDRINGRLCRFVPDRRGSVERRTARRGCGRAASIDEPWERVRGRVASNYIFSARPPAATQSSTVVRGGDDRRMLFTTKGAIYIAEDHGDMQLCRLREQRDGTIVIDAFL